MSNRAELHGIEKRAFGAREANFTVCNKTNQRGFENEARKRIRHSHIQRKNNQSVFSIVPGLNRVIPVVERPNERTNKADGYARLQPARRRHFVGLMIHRFELFVFRRQLNLRVFVEDLPVAHSDHPRREIGLEADFTSIVVREMVDWARGRG
jgi:hypothetical protein